LISISSRGFDFSGGHYFVFMFLHHRFPVRNSLLFRLGADQELKSQKKLSDAMRASRMKWLFSGDFFFKSKEIFILINLFQCLYRADFYGGWHESFRLQAEKTIIASARKHWHN
jgi:hypothetical protein